MPEAETIKRAKKDKRQGKAASTQAGEFVREEIESIRRGEHGARSPEQAIAIGLSKARRAGVKLKPPEKGEAKASMRKKAAYDYEVGQGERHPRHRPKAAKAATRRLKKEPRSTASHQALSRQAKKAASRRTAADRSTAAKKAAKTRAKRSGKRVVH